MDFYKDYNCFIIVVVIIILWETREISCIHSHKNDQPMVSHIHTNLIYVKMNYIVESLIDST